MEWIARNRHWRFPHRPLVMGIVNVTPDSFSDGGAYLEPEAAVRHALRLEAAGADILDIGGESTRPGAQPVPVGEELRRVMPVLERLKGRCRAALSIDTRKVEVARAALAAGAHIVNDIGAATAPPAMHALVAETGAGYICMHMQGEPATMQQAPRYRDVVAEVEAFFQERLEVLSRKGVAPEQVALDVGIGFGKTLEHNLALLAALDRFTGLGRPLVLGLSRKSVISQLLGVEAHDRLAGSLAGACWGISRGVQVLRVHDVAATRQAVDLWQALRERAA